MCLSAWKGVHGAKVTMEDETARVEFDASQVDTDAMEQAIETAGYEAEEK